MSKISRSGLDICHQAPNFAEICPQAHHRGGVTFLAVGDSSKGHGEGFKSFIGNFEFLTSQARGRTKFSGGGGLNSKISTKCAVFRLLLLFNLSIWASLPPSCPLLALGLLPALLNLMSVLREIYQPPPL